MLGFSQPMLAAGQLDKRPKKLHIMTQSHSTAPGKCLTAFFSLTPAGFRPGEKENTANRSWLTRLARLALTPLATGD